MPYPTIDLTIAITNGPRHCKQLCFMRYIFLIILFGLGMKANAQFYIFKAVDQVELTGGPSLVSLYNDVIDNKATFRQPKIGYTFKVGLIYNINERLSFNPNLAYERKGLKSKYEVSYYDPTIDSTQCQCTTSQGTVLNNSNLDYITFSTLIRFNLKKNQFYLSSGAFVSYLLKSYAKQEFQWNGGVNYTHGKQGNKDIDAGVSFTLGYRIPLAKKRSLVFEITEDLGLLNIANSKYSSTKTTTNTISIRIGLSLSTNYKQTKTR